MPKHIITTAAFVALICALAPLAEATLTSADSSNPSSVTPLSAEKNSSADSISALAAKAKSVVDDGLSSFSAETLPHQAKDLRKQIVRLRDILDVFSHHFAHEIKLWDDVRDGLDDGYTVVGAYKDLFDANPQAVDEAKDGKVPSYKNMKKVQKIREEVLSWKQIYFARGGLADQLVELFSNIRELDESNTVHSKKFSDFFWGGVDELPSSRLTAAQNAFLLVQAQADLAVEEHPHILEMKDPTSEKNEIIFHDHRKRLRTIAKVCNVANALTENTCQAAAVKQIESLVIELGEVEDLIITGRHFEEDGKKAKAGEAYQDARKKLKKLKQKFEGVNMLEPLTKL